MPDSSFAKGTVIIALALALVLGLAAFTFMPSPARYQARIHFKSGTITSYSKVSNLPTVKAGVRNCIALGGDWCSTDLYAIDSGQVVYTETIVLSEVERITEWRVAGEREKNHT